MDELVKNTAIVDGALVKAVSALMPGDTIEKILDAAREVNLKRILNSVKARGYETVIHLVDDLHADGSPEEDIKTLLTWLGHEDPEAKALYESGLFNSVLKFISESEPPSTGCCTHLKLKVLKWWTRNTKGKTPLP
jgi:hypothetical protein